MVKLTKAQRALLQRLVNGEDIRRRAVAGLQFFGADYKHINTATLHALMGAGLVTYTTVKRQYNRYEVLELTDAGRAVLS